MGKHGGLFTLIVKSEYYLFSFILTLISHTAMLSTIREIYSEIKTNSSMQHLFRTQIVNKRVGMIPENNP